MLLKGHFGYAGRSDPLFSEDAIAVINQASRGYPPTANNLALAAPMATRSTQVLNLLDPRISVHRPPEDCSHMRAGNRSSAYRAAAEDRGRLVKASWELVPILITIDKASASHQPTHHPSRRLQSCPPPQQ